MSVVADRLLRLRAWMSAQGVSAVIVPSADPHLSEYLPDRWQGRMWLTGFTGSSGTAVVTAEFAGLWTDSRYWQQAAVELQESPVTLMKMGDPGTPSHADWLVKHLEAGARVAVDGQVISLTAHRALAETLSASGIELLTVGDPLTDIWSDRPGIPLGEIYEHLPPNACVTRADKFKQVRTAMHDAGAQAHLLTALDDIAWIFNLRGSDVDYNPVFLAHALIEETRATLFVSPGKINPTLNSVLAADGVNVVDYAGFDAALGALAGDLSLLIDPARVTRGAVDALNDSIRLVEKINPSTLIKSRKTDDELQRIRTVMEHDGAALCEFFAWFETRDPSAVVTELTIDEVLTAARARRPGFVSLSFPTIAAFNANGAMPHYRATAHSHARIEGDGLLLIDSGGQYLGGTTDITRVVGVGTPTDAQKQDYTLVLKGMIALSRATFPKGIAAPMLDAIARGPIWEAAADFGHGTGHGVGYFLNVHEGPQSISYHTRPTEHMAMLPGMITSNEPGIYRPGRWGIRIENLLVNRPWQENELGVFLAFETLTLCPIDTRCIALALLREDEIEWLNNYHDEVRQRILPLVSDEATSVWLVTRTQHVARFDGVN
jgi:Xaa-Pro aminopeptidase